MTCARLSLLSCMLASNVALCQSPEAIGQRRMILTARQLGAVRLCAPLDTISRVFGSVSDTVLESEEVTWRGKVVRFSGGGRALFEASWADAQRVWKISTTSPAVTTSKGQHVGTRLAELKRAGEPLEIRIPEGRLIIILKGQGLGATVDSAAESAFMSNSEASDTLNPDALPSDARITSLFTLGGCQ